MLSAEGRHSAALRPQASFPGRPLFPLFCTLSMPGPRASLHARPRPSARARGTTAAEARLLLQFSLWPRQHPCGAGAGSSGAAAPARRGGGPAPELAVPGPRLQWGNFCRPGQPALAGHGGRRGRPPRPAQRRPPIAGLFHFIPALFSPLSARAVHQRRPRDYRPRHESVAGGCLCATKAAPT